MRNIFKKVMVVFALAMVLLASASIANAGGTTGAGCSGLVCCANPPECNFDDFQNTVANIVIKLLQLGLAAVSLLFAYVGYEYMMSGDDSGRRQKAHGKLTKAGIGLVITLTAFLIVELITRTLGLDVSIIDLKK